MIIPPISKPRPTARQLQDEARERRQKRRECYETVVDKAYSRIACKARAGWVRAIYEVPPFLVGSPPYNVEDCVRFVARVLRRDGYVVEVFGRVLYVSWDAGEKTASSINGPS